MNDTSCTASEQQHEYTTHMYQTLNETKITNEINQSAVCHASYNHRIEIVTTAPETQCKAKEIGGNPSHGTL